MKVAVVDIGSNAVRSTFYGLDKIHGDEILLKKLSYLRLPIRLGEGVFAHGAIPFVLPLSNKHATSNETKKKLYN